jgi:hypothetical protein
MLGRMSFAGATVLALTTVGCVGGGSDPCAEAAALAESCHGTPVTAPATCEGEVREAAEQVVASGCEAIPEDGKADAGSWMCSRALRWMGFCTLSSGEANEQYIERLARVAPQPGEYEGLVFLEPGECEFIVEHELGATPEDSYFSATLLTEERTVHFPIGTHEVERVTDFSATSTSRAEQIYLEADVPTFGKTHITMELIRDRTQDHQTFRVWMGSGTESEDLSCQFYVCPDGSRWSPDAACPR